MTVLPKNTRTLAKFCTWAGTIAMLGGCVGQEAGSSTDLAALAPGGQGKYVALAYGQTDQASRFDPSHHAVIALPVAAGHIRSISASSGAAGFRQVVLLSGPASTPDRITLLTGAPQNAALDGALSQKPSETSIRAELAIEFPGSQMDVWPKPLANAYGPYGLASGQSGTAVCVYAWQWIDDLHSLEKLGFQGPAAWRVRLCRPRLDTARAIAWLGEMTAGRSIAATARGNAGPPSAKANHITREPSTHLANQTRAVADESGVGTGMPINGPLYLAPVPGPFVGVQTGSSPGNNVVNSLSRDETGQDMAVDLPPEATHGPRTVDRVP